MQVSPNSKVWAVYISGGHLNVGPDTLPSRGPPPSKAALLGKQENWAGIAVQWALGMQSCSVCNTGHGKPLQWCVPLCSICPLFGPSGGHNGGEMPPHGMRGCLARGARARCDCSPVDLERRYHRMLPKSGHRGLSMTTRWPIVVFGWKYQCPGVEVGSRAPCALENIGVIMFCLLCFPRDRWQ